MYNSNCMKGETRWIIEKRRINKLLEKEFDSQIAKRLEKADNELAYSDFEVRGEIAKKQFKVNKDDGWE